MTILVTGGAGFIGSNFVVDWLNECQEPVINLDKLTYAGNLSNLQQVQLDSRHIFIRGDICNEALVLRLLNEYKVRAIVHFAAESHVDRSISAPDAFIQTNIVGTFKLLEAAKSYWQNLAEPQKSLFRFLHVSTDEVFGSLNQEADAFQETTAYAPNSPYSASKASSDHLVRAYHHTYGLPTLTTHCSNNYGPYQFPEKLIPMVIHSALTLKNIPIYGNGQQIRDWLYVKDHCTALSVVLERGKIGETYNIGGNCEKKNLDVVKTICSLLDALNPRADGLSYHSQISFVPDRLGHDIRYAINSTKMTASLGWTPSETFASGIDKTVRWYLNQSTWLENIISGNYMKQIGQEYA